MLRDSHAAPDRTSGGKPADGSAVKIIENYRGWQPPFDAAAVTRRLLDRLPRRHLIGLDAVVLTCAARMSRRRRRRKTRSRGRKVPIVRCLGLYHQKWRGDPAWIELFVDNIVARLNRVALAPRTTRELLIGRVLFHELGHHLHATQRPEYREQEAVAERWEARLLGEQLG